MAVDSGRDYPGLHLRFGWWTLLVFLALGLLLDALHAFKVGWYVNVDAETRRLMWTLAHTHGTLVAVVNIVFGLTLGGMAESPPWAGRASICMIGAAIFMPLGFFLGGLVIHGGDPGPGSLLVPPGALLLIAGVALIAAGIRRRRS